MPRFPVLLIVTLLAATGAWGLSPAEARRLLDRAGMGDSPGEEALLLPLDRAAAVDALLDGFGPAPAEIPATASEGALLPKDKPGAGGKEDRKAERDRFQVLQQGWWTQVRTSAQPLHERLVIFWHNHFTSAFESVKSSKALARQHELIRASALGNFRDLTRAMTIDPAMMVYLNTKDNRLGKPNENFARELMELFVLGEGNYTEQDVREAARALTGLSFRSEDGSLVVNPKQHDGGDKTIFGATGRWSWDGLLDLIFAQDAAARWVPRKLALEFWGVEPDPVRLDELAALFRASDFAIRPLVRALLVANEFWDAKVPLIRSPLEFYAASARGFQLDPPADRVVASLKRLGQGLMEPLSVKGWPVGAGWIDADALSVRRQAAETLVALARKGARPAAGVPGLGDPVTTLLTDDWQFK